MTQDHDYWEKKREEVNALVQELQNKPASEKMGYSIHPGGILNAYREGDCTHYQAVEALKKYAETWGFILSQERFLHLRALCNAFAVADEEDAKAATISVRGLGIIEWNQEERQVIITLEKEGE